jgi:23S rRNA pseudouridine1911/1915/1917 synthase
VHTSQILYEDNHLLIVDKPADWVVQGAREDQRSLLESARTYIKQKYQKPGNVFLGVVSRLDAPVTGVVPLARTSKAAARLSEQFRERTPLKLYLAIVDGIPDPPSGRLEHDLVRPAESSVTRVAASSHSDAQRAILEYRTIRSFDGKSLLEIKLITGRKHQVRCQLSAVGCPILGDRLYGANEPFPSGIALHCRSMTLDHPTLGKPISVVAPLPIYWPAWAKREDLQ